MTVLAHRSATTTAPRAATSRAATSRDVHVWEARVRRILRPVTVELVDGTSAQRHRLVAAGVRRGMLEVPHATASRTDSRADLSELRLEDLLPAAHRELHDLELATAPEPAGSLEGNPDEATVEAHVLRAFSGVSRGRTAWLVPFALPTGALGVLVTDSLVAVLALQERAEVGAGPLRRIEDGAPWTAYVHSVGLPLDDEDGQPVRDDVPWPCGTRFAGELRSGTEVWTCGSPVAWA
ncbi:Phosphoenolpyruvate carboxykinase [Quadrisphaera granulorum]|uniref:Phosphoenolpyruvate carboxykinase n=1 Tax=Quadrisphaera granulorum TaxID=317664 RepID=A0A316AFD2_9ACTN|nr:hypothetical protein [Quadrisphaera granulorum]PWJ55690.1 phosphoenolpyruvate carboxykinase [Quadrisphaera granulorum]SZE95187.1 Phosphoenolpyruvate carboxykinase [Quadrisphaera granulorum]